MHRFVQAIHDAKAEGRSSYDIKSMLVKNSIIAVS